MTASELAFPCHEAKPPLSVEGLHNVTHITNVTCGQPPASSDLPARQISPSFHGSSATVRWMPMQQSLSNYLRAYRKRSGLTVVEVAYLIGTEHGSTVSRHERGDRSIDLDTALRYSAIFGEDVRRLFEGDAERLEGEVRQRAETLAVSVREMGCRQRVVEHLDRLAQTEV